MIVVTISGTKPSAQAFFFLLIARVRAAVLNGDCRGEDDLVLVPALEPLDGGGLGTRELRRPSRVVVRDKSSASALFGKGTVAAKPAYRDAPGLPFLEAFASTLGLLGGVSRPLGAAWRGEAARMGEVKVRRWGTAVAGRPLGKGLEGTTGCLWESALM